MEVIDPTINKDRRKPNQPLTIKEECLIITDIDLCIGRIGKFVGGFLLGDPNIFKEYIDEVYNEELDEKKKQYKQCLKLLSQAVGIDFNTIKSKLLDQSVDCSITKRKARKGQMYMLTFCRDKNKENTILYLRKDWAQWFEHWAILVKFKSTIQKYFLKTMKKLDEDNSLDISQRISKFISYNENEHSIFLLNLFKNTHRFFTKFIHGEECEEFMDYFENDWFSK